MVRRDIDKQMANIIHDYENGLNIKGLCKKYNASYNAIMKRLKIRFSEKEMKELNRLNNRKSEAECIAISKRQNTSGYYRVSRNGSAYVYTYYDVDGSMCRITRSDIDELRCVVVGRGLKWVEY